MDFLRHLFDVITNPYFWIPISIGWVVLYLINLERNFLMTLTPAEKARQTELKENNSRTVAEDTELAELDKKA